MKIPKEAQRTARQLLRATLRNGKVDGNYAQAAVTKILADKPRHYLALLTAYQRMLRLELEQRHAIVESAQTLSDSERSNVLSDLQKKYGDDITSEFRVNADLLGGIRVKLGSNVWDGTVKSRLDSLREKLSA